MLTKDMEDRVTVVAAVNGGKISVQSLELIAMTHNADGALDTLKQYCGEKHYSVFDELEGVEDKESELVENEEEEEEEEDKEDKSGINELIDSLNYSMISDSYVGMVQYAIRKMSPREREMLIYLLGLKDGIPHTYDETAERFGCSHKRVDLLVFEVYHLYGCHPRRHRSRLKEYIGD